MYCVGMFTEAIEIGKISKDVEETKGGKLGEREGEERDTERSEVNINRSFSEQAFTWKTT